MIFAFDFPHKTGKKFSRPYYNGKKVKFNGLMDLPKNRHPYFGPAPPSLVDLCIKFDKSFRILSVESAVALCPPNSGKSFYYLLETQGPPQFWLGTEDGYENTGDKGENLDPNCDTWYPVDIANELLNVSKISINIIIIDKYFFKLK